MPVPAGLTPVGGGLRLRGRTPLGATSVRIVTDHAGRLDDVDGRLYLIGLQPDLTERLRRTGSVEGPVRAFEATRSWRIDLHGLPRRRGGLVKKRDPAGLAQVVSHDVPGSARRPGPGEPRSLPAS